MPLMRLATHVAELPSWTTFTLNQDVLDMTPDWKPVIAGSRAELLKLFDDNAADARSSIARATDQDWERTWTFKFNGKEVMSMPKYQVMSGVILNHLVHHRAQLGVYLRLLEIEVPGMYGPSADEKKFWEALA